MESKKKFLKQMLAMMMCLVMLLGTQPTVRASEAEGTEESPVTSVYAASDFQASNVLGDDTAKGQLIMETIIRQMVSDGYDIGGALICGDYSRNGNTWKNVDVELNNAGLAAVAQVLQDELGLDYDDVVYVQGNHDPADTVGLDASGANDTEHYGVYVLHEDDFQWKQGADSSAMVKNSGNDDNDAEETTKATAEALQAYLQAKVDAGYGQPIFVCAHIPLHYSYRTFNASHQDNIFSEYIFDVLNEYGKELNIIFLFGHDHSDTYDDYLGGGAVYLPVGDTILIPAAGDRNVYKECTLNFTYMNAGYVGYYDGKCEVGGLTSTVFEIYEDKVTVARYRYNYDSGVASASLTDLKEAGVWNRVHKYKEFTSDKNNTTVYSGEQTILLKEVAYDPVETGDASGMGSLVFTMGLSLAVCAGVSFFGKRRRYAG